MLRWADGFEQYGNIARMTEGVGGGAAWSDTAGVTLSTLNPATGAYHMRIPDNANGSNRMRRIFGSAQPVVGVGYRFNISDLPDREGLGFNDGGFVLADFRDVSNVAHWMVVMGTDGSVIANRGGALTAANLGGTVFGRSEPCIAPGGYHHFEVKTKIGNADGYAEIRVNEVTVLNLTGFDTQNSANATAAQLALGKSGGSVTSSSAGYGTFDLDDVFAWDEDTSDPDNTVVDFIGDKGCYWLPPTADTATSEFNINASATAYGALDEVPPSGTDYLDTPLTAARTIVAVAALPGHVSEVIAMIPVIYARKDESGSVDMRGGVVVDGIEAVGVTDNPSTEYAYLRPSPKTVDPSTGVAWANDAEPQLLIERTG